MNIYQLQDYLINEITTGHPDDFLVNLDEDQIREEFSALLYVWSQNRHDARKLQTSLNNEIAAIVCRATQTMQTDPIEYCPDDIRREREDAAYMAWKDKI